MFQSGPWGFLLQSLLGKRNPEGAVRGQEEGKSPWCGRTLAVGFLLVAPSPGPSLVYWTSCLVTFSSTPSILLEITLRSAGRINGGADGSRGCWQGAKEPA